MFYMLNVLFVACINIYCEPRIVQINPFPYYGYDVAAYHVRKVDEHWCKENAQFYLREISKIEVGNITNYVAYKYKLGNPNIIFLPDTIQCWPIEKGPH